MIVVEGANQLANLSRTLKEAGNKGLQRELSKGISAALKPVTAAARQSAKAKLPTRGGLAARVAASKFSTRRRANGLRLTATNRYTLSRLDAGTVRHPVFGNRNVWVTQTVDRGWWTEPTEDAAPRARAEIIKAMNTVAKKIHA